MSVFLGKGKKKAFEIVQKCPQGRQSMQSLGTSWNVDDDLLNACERLVCLLYGIDHNDVNDVRYQLFSTKGTQSHLLPLPQGMHYTSTCYVQIIKLESGEMHLKEWQKFQLLTGMDGY